MTPGLLVINGTQEICLEVPENKSFWVGRSKHCDYVISNDPIVSGNHCLLLREGSQLAIKDVSTNGIFINGRKVHKETTILGLADKIQIGHIQFQIIDLSRHNSPQTTLDMQACIEELKDQNIISEEQMGLNIFGSYLNLEVLGEGAFGKVFKAIHLPSKKFVALKIFFDTDEVNSEEFVERFLREVEVLKKLKHPSVISFYDAGSVQSDGKRYHFIALEYFEGINLEKYVEANGFLSWKRVLSILIQCTEALAHMHSKGILHRDLKPANILYQESRGKAKIVDWGLTKSIIAEETSPIYSTETQAGMGSPSFMPYEQWTSLKSVDERADVYSLGATTYFLLSGKLPYEEVSNFGGIIQIYFAMQKEELIPLNLLCAELPKSFEEVVKKMMAIKAENRPKSSELLEELKQLSATLLP